MSVLHNSRNKLWQTEKRKIVAWLIYWFLLVWLFSVAPFYEWSLVSTFSLLSIEKKYQEMLKLLYSVSVQLFAKLAHNGQVLPMVGK